MAVPFDPVTLEIGETPRAVLADVSIHGFSYLPQMSVSLGGVLAYTEGGATLSEIVEVDDDGDLIRVLDMPPRNYTSPRVSPDGKRLAVVAYESAQNSDIWLHDLRRGGTTRLTYDGSNAAPVWSADSKRITFSSWRHGFLSNIYRMPVDGSGEPERLTESEMLQVALSSSADGKRNALFEISLQDSIFGISIMNQDGTQLEKPSFRQGAFFDVEPNFSPDGNWIAFTSERSGGWEVYVAPYPGRGQIELVSTDGGSQPVWDPDGDAIYFRKGKDLYKADLDINGTVEVDKPEMLFGGNYILGDSSPAARSVPLPNYDVGARGNTFFMLRAIGDPKISGQSTEIIIDPNWFETLIETVPQIDAASN